MNVINWFSLLSTEPVEATKLGLFVLASIWFATGFVRGIVAGLGLRRAVEGYQQGDDRE